MYYDKNIINNVLVTIIVLAGIIALAVIKVAQTHKCNDPVAAIIQSEELQNGKITR